MARPAAHLRIVDPAASAELAAVHTAPSAVDACGAWEQLFAQHGRYVAQVALRVLGRDDEVDDVVQEVFLSVMADIDKLRNPLAVRGWLKTVTVRKAYAALKQRGRRRFWARLGFG